MTFDFFYPVHMLTRCLGISVGKAPALDQRGSGFEWQYRQDIRHDQKIFVTEWKGILSGESGEQLL